MADTVTIVAQNCLLELDGTPIATGTFSLNATDQNDIVIPLGFGGGGQADTSAVSRSIVNGSLVGNPLNIANPATSSPTAYFRIVIQNTTTSPTVTTVYRRVQIVGNASGQWNFAIMPTGLTLPGVSVAYVQGPAGPTGPNGSNGIASPVSLAQIRQATLPAIANYLDPALLTSGQFADVNTGAAVAQTGYATSGRIAANTGGRMICDTDIPYVNAGSSTNGVAMFDQNGAMLPGLYGRIAAGNSFPIRSDCTFLVIGFATGYAKPPAVYNGSSLPANPLPFVGAGVDAAATHYRGSYAGTNSYAVNDIAVLSGIAYVATATNPVTPAVAAVPAQSAHISPNLFNPSTAVTGIQIIQPGDPKRGTADSGFANYTTSAKMAVTPGTTYSMNWGATDSNAYYGAIFWSGNTIVSTVPIPYANGATFTAPAGVDSITVTFNGGPASSQQFGVMVAATSGSPAVAAVPSQPPTNTAFWQPLVAASGTDATAVHYKGAFSGTSTYSPGDTVSVGTSGSYLCIAATSAAGPTQLFNPSTAVTGIQIIQAGAPNRGSVDSSFANYTTSAKMAVTPGTAYSMNWGATDSNAYYGAIFWSGSTIVSTMPIPFANGATFTAPAGVDSVTITFNGGPASSQMFVAGSLPSSYVAYGQPVSGSSATPVTDTAHWVPLAPAATSANSPANGKKIGVLGDSISSSLFGFAWETVVTNLTGATFPFIDARPGRNFTQAFECYGVTTIGTNMNPSSGAPTNQGTVSTSNGNYANNGTVGHTLAQDLAALDILILYLGTNDQGFALGAPGDSVSTDTQYGHIRWVVESLLAAKPSIRLLLLTVQYNGFGNAGQTAATANATETVGNTYGAAVLNLNKVGGTNSLTASVMLQSDNVHPSTFNFNNRLGPLAARFIERN